jgi:D-alanine-D-alanine ligase
MPKIRLGLIFGGRSAEHEVSLRSARSVLAAIDRDKYDLTLIGISKDGKWLAAPQEVAAPNELAAPQKLAASQGQGASKELAGADPLATLVASGGLAQSAAAMLLAEPGKRELLAVTPNGTGHSFRLAAIAELDVVFPLLHGPFGEDGTVQGLLELADLPYVGSGVLASALAMDKAMCKQVLRAAGLKVTDWFVATRSEIERDAAVVAARAEKLYRFPIFTKPANLGSSVGVVKAHDHAQLLAGLRESARYDRRVLVEPGVNAREIEVSVLGNADPLASAVGEVVPSREFYDYEAKYVVEGSRLIIPAAVPAAVAEQARAAAVAAFQAIDASGLARVDFLLDRDSGELYLNEVNTLPGFTDISMYPKLWQAAGLAYPALIDRLVALALERQAEKDKNVTRFEGPRSA